MDKVIKDRIDVIRQGCIPKGYNRSRYMLYPEDWGEPCALNTVLTENKERNKNLEYDKDDVLSVSGDYGVVNQIDLLGRSYAGESVAPYHIVHTGDIVYTKSPLKKNPHGIIKQNKGNSGIVSTLYAVYHCNNNITGQYIENYFSIDSYLNNYLKPIVKRGAKNDMKINNEDVLTGLIPLPPLAEQEKISEILDHYDKLIKLCEAKLDEYKSLKKTCLSKMFPRNGSTVPELRFPEFTGSWEQRQFGEIVSRSSVMSDICILPRVEYEDIVSGIGQLNKDIGKKENRKIGLLFHEGDVLYGKLRPYLQNWLLPSFSGVAVGDFWVLQPQNADSSFVYRLIQTKQFDEVANQSTGTKMPRADWKLVSKTEFSVPPSISEQAQIGTFFRHLDHLITLHQREVEEYTRLKKAMTQLLLTGIVRVKV